MKITPVSKRIQDLADALEPLYRKVPDPGHEWNHISRVFQWATHLAQKESEKTAVNLEVVQAAALLHDVVNVPKNHPDRSRASEMAALKAAEYMTAFEPELIQAVGNAILEHSYSRGLKPSTIESACVQDADRLDAIGAIGVFRTAICGTLMKSQFYNELEPFPKSRELDDRHFMVDHFFNKLLRLEEFFTTTSGKAEAKHRTHFMRHFLEQLESEVSGPK